MRSYLGILAITLALLATAPFARADIIVGNFGAFTPANARRYRESDAAFLVQYAFPDETLQGMSFGPGGDLYLAGNTLGFGQISRDNATTGALVGPLVTLGQSGYQEPNGIAFTNGSVFTTSHNFNGGVTGVLRFNSNTGAFQGIAVAPNTNGLGAPVDVITAPNGNLLVNDGQHVNRYDGATLAFLSSFVNIGNGVNSLDFMTFGPDGNFYVSDRNDNLIARYNGTTGAFLGIFVTPAANEQPSGLAFGNDGNLYVASGPQPGAGVLRYNGGTGAFLNTFLAPDPTINTATWVLNAPDLPEPCSATTILVAALALTRRSRRDRH